MCTALIASQAFSLNTTDLQLSAVPALLQAKPSVMGCISTVFLKHSDLHFEKREMAAADVVMAELANNRGPAALLRAPPGDGTSAKLLLTLANDLQTCGQLLVVSSSNIDMVCLPRQAASTDGIPFCVFLTRVAGVDYMGTLVSNQQVGVVLDLDATLLESELLDPFTRPQGWDSLDWRSDTFINSAGEYIDGRHASLPAEGGTQSVHAASWLKDGLAHNYRVRVRPGWSHLKDFLRKEKHRFSTTICSLGRPVYVQVAATILDPMHELIPKADYGGRVISARPDGVHSLPDKTPAVAVGLSAPNKDDYGMRFAPMFAVDDLPEYYPLAHRDVVYPMEPYKPAAQPPIGIDAGDALCALTDSLRQFWQHCYADNGAIPALKFCTSELLHRLQFVPIDHEDILLFFGFVCDTQGKACWNALSVENFLQQEADQAGMLAEALNRNLAASSGGDKLAMPEENWGSEVVLSENLPPRPSSKLEVRQERHWQPPVAPPPLAACPTVVASDGCAEDADVDLLDLPFVEGTDEFVPAYDN